MIHFIIIQSGIINMESMSIVMCVKLQKSILSDIRSYGSNLYVYEKFKDDVDEMALRELLFRLTWGLSFVIRIKFQDDLGRIVK